MGFTEKLCKNIVCLLCEVGQTICLIGCLDRIDICVGIDYLSAADFTFWLSLQVVRAACILSHPIPNTNNSASAQIILPQKQVQTYLWF